MKTVVLTLILAGIFLLNARAQDKYFSKEGKISFFSKAPHEDIEAHSTGGIAILDLSNGEVVARVSIKSFEFEKKLMEEHFNENYLESDRYPHGEFKGFIEEFDFEKLED